MTTFFYERQRALANDWRELVLEAMEHQKATADYEPETAANLALVTKVDSVIDRHLDEWKVDIQKRIGMTRDGVPLPYPEEILAEKLQVMFLERLNAVLPRPFSAVHLDAQGRWRGCFEMHWLV